MNAGPCLVQLQVSFVSPFRQLTRVWSSAGFELVLFAGWGIIPTYAKKIGLGDEFYLMLALNV